MNTTNYIFMLVVSFFLLSRRTRATALVLFVCYIDYYFITITFKDERIWFLAVALSECLTGLVILKIHYKVYTVASVAYLCFLSVPFTFLGWVLYEYGYPGIINNNLGLVIMVAQVLAMTMRLLLDAGLYKYCLNYRLFRAINYYLKECYNELQDKKIARKAKKCQAR